MDTYFSFAYLSAFIFTNPLIQSSVYPLYIYLLYIYASFIYSLITHQNTWTFSNTAVRTSKSDSHLTRIDLMSCKVPGHPCHKFERLWAEREQFDSQDKQSFISLLWLYTQGETGPVSVAYCCVISSAEVTCTSSFYIRAHLLNNISISQYMASKFRTINK
jgi:hypothetical protein